MKNKILNGKPKVFFFWKLSALPSYEKYFTTSGSSHPTRGTGPMKDV